MNDIVVVGNAPLDQNETGSGRWIDSHKLVVRFNNFQTVGFETDRGSKTSIWVFIQNHWKVSLPRNELIPWVWQVCPNQRNTEAQYHETVAAGRPRWILRAREIMPVSSEIGCNMPSTGALAVYYLVQAYLTIDIIGFNHFSSEHLHYYSDGQPEYISHDREAEACYFRNLIAWHRIEKYTAG